MEIQKNKNPQVNQTNGDIRCVDTQTYLQEVVRILETGKQVVIPVSGNSMLPFLCAGRDFVLLESAKDRVIKKGDIVLFLRPMGQFVLHRVYSVDKENYKMVGDGQHFIEGPIEKDQIKAVAVGIKREGKWIKKWSFKNLFFRWIWIRAVSFRKGSIQLYRRLKR